MTDHRQRAQDAAGRLVAAARAMLELIDFDDPAGPVQPRYDGAGGGRTRAPSSPSESQALHHVDPDRNGGRDPRAHLARYAKTVERWAEQAEADVADLAGARRPDKPCECCRDRDHLATHWRNVDGRRLELCLGCHDYHRAHDYLCSDDVHARRPRIRWCDCSLECCPSGCSDRAEEGRKVSGRCNSRMSRARKRARVMAET